jgi:hypothetical protein
VADLNRWAKKILLNVLLKNMKVISLTILALSCLSIAFSATAPNKPPFKPASSEAKAEFEKSRSERHKWKKGQAFPETLAEAGLLSDITLVWTDLYLDGGTKGYLFKDSAGHFLAVCTGPGFQTKDHPRRIDAAVGSRLFIGGLHYTEEVAALVPAGSKTEAWLRKLLEEKKG